jgi:hypothetical protein
MYYIKVSSTSTVWKHVKGVRHWMVQPQTTRFLIIWTVFSFVGFCVTIFPFGWTKSTFNYLSDQCHSHNFKPSMLSLLSTSSETVFTSTLSAVPVLFLDDWPVRPSFVSLLNKHFYAQISIQFYRHTTRRTSWRTNTIWFSLVEWTSATVSESGVHS